MSILLERHNPASQMMGEILISQQWVTPSQLGEALAEQRKSNDRLGAVLVRLGFLSEMELNFILAEQKGNTLTGESENVTQRLGDLLRKSKRLSQRDLAIAVDEQKRTNEKLGEVLVRLGLLDALELDAVLALQDDFNHSDPLAVRLLLGEILIASKKLTRKDLSKALENQRMTKKQIGQVLVDGGFVNKFDIRNALKIQTKMVAASMLAMMSVVALTGCGAPNVPNSATTPFGKNYTYDKVVKQANYGPGGKRLAQFNTAAKYTVANLPGGRQIQAFADGSRVVKDVPFFQQGTDNTCAQASTSVVLNYWGAKQSYQTLVNEQNRWNLPTGSENIVKYVQSKGLKAKAYREGNIGFLKKMIDDGKPAIVMLEFNNDLFQQHYITVVGYNDQSGKIIFHDSIDGPYRQLDEDEFFAMWQSEHLSKLPVFGGGNYKGLVIEIEGNS
ncbi:MAG: C39 family peptidase [Candidatus Sericytochromatia bacterium]